MSATETLDTRPSTGAGDSPSLSSSSPSSSNPLVAGREESRSAVSGSGVVEDIWGITHGLSQGSWLETGLSSLSLAADAVGVGADPLGTLIAWGAGWLIDHFGPLKSWMDELLGDADSVRADAATWSNVAQAMGECADTLEGDERNLMGEQVDATADAYRASNADTVCALRAASGAADAMGRATSVLAEVVGLVHDLLRDAISAIVGTLASAIIEAIATCGLAIPLIIAQVQVKVGAKATQMAAHITGVLKSARTLGHNLTHLSGLLDMLRGMLTRAKNTAANAAHMFTGAKPAAAAAAGGATPHGPITGTTAHTGTRTSHATHHTPPAPDTPTPTPDIPPTTPKPRRRRKLSTDRNPHGSYVDEEGTPHIHPDDPRPFLKSRPSYAKDQALQVWEEAAQGGTTVTDVAGRTIVWKPGEPRLGVWDMGHKPGHKYHDTWLKYVNGELSPAEFAEKYRNPNYYRVEHYKTNRGHEFE
ncbi:HNH/ENDO VII family nuclease [Schaalia georgiae]|uniref:HNH/ENDO VII family nuclease n=1 Tax=Schaalia georgiae TaxID=52768 RepID=UPI00103D2228|nr:HNH/ENDO VII family nuclease [Schaalia georgiae]